MDILGEYVKFQTPDGAAHEGVVVRVFPHETIWFAQVQCRDGELRDISISVLRQTFQGEYAEGGYHAKRDMSSEKSDGQNGRGIMDACALEKNPLLESELDVNAFEVVVLRRPVPAMKPLANSQSNSCALPLEMPPCFIKIPSVDAVRRCQQDIQRLLNSDPCPVLSRLPYSQIGDQLLVPWNWRERAGCCDPRQKRTLPRPAKTIGYLVRLGMATLGEKVVYRGGRDKVMAEGWIANNGILCARCGYVVGCTEFEKCAGMRMRKPGKHIQFSDGRSLLDYRLRMRDKLL